VAVRGAAFGLVAAVSVAACSADGAGEFSSSFSVAAAMAEIPASLSPDVDTRIDLADVDAVSEATGVERDADLDLTGVSSAWAAILALGASERGVPREVVVPLGQGLVRGALYEEDATVAELGWSFEDVDAYVSVYTSKADFNVVALREDTAQLPDPDDDGIIRIGEGEDGQASVTDRTPSV
jgi:hypothetical protein